MGLWVTTSTMLLSMLQTCGPVVAYFLFPALFENLNFASRHMQTMTANLSVSMARDDIWRTHCGKIGKVDEHCSIHENFHGTSRSNGTGTDPEAGEAGEKNRCSPVANGCTTSGEHTLNPQIPRVKWEHLLRIREEPSIACL